MECAMEMGIPSLNDLFAQLGLPSGPADIERFIATHSPLPESLKLDEAPFWSPSQAAFLREEILEDSEWAELIEGLNVRLRTKPAA
ncbi:MAG: hypothetical protein H6R10_1037 [Rhodocyclaceae bacterium]|nr:hypothetical protein [Rhodocyclaceae bacterium]